MAVEIGPVRVFEAMNRFTSWAVCDMAKNTATSLFWPCSELASEDRVYFRLGDVLGLVITDTDYRFDLTYKGA